MYVWILPLMTIISKLGLHSTSSDKAAVKKYTSPPRYLIMFHKFKNSFYTLYYYVHTDFNINHFLLDSSWHCQLVLKELFFSLITWSIINLFVPTSFFMGRVCLHSRLLGGRPFDTRGRGLWFFLRDQTCFFDSQLKRSIFFQTLLKANNFFLSGKTIFSPFISFDSLYTMLSSRGVTAFTWNFHHVFW